MSAVYCRHCGTRVGNDPWWRRRGFCDEVCQSRFQHEPEPIDISPGAFMERVASKEAGANDSVLEETARRMWTLIRKHEGGQDDGGET